MSRETYIHSLRQAIAYADIAAGQKPMQGHSDDRRWWCARANDLRITLKSAETGHESSALQRAA